MTVDPYPPSPEALTLEFRSVCAQQLLPVGLHRVDAEVRRSMFAEMAAILTAYVLTEPGGVEVRDSATYVEHHRPRWLPRVLWRLIPSETKKVEARAVPLWTYPAASIRFPDLGHPYVDLIVESGRRWPR